MPATPSLQKQRLADPSTLLTTQPSQNSELLVQGETLSQGNKAWSH